MSEDTTTETASQADTSEQSAPAVEENPSGDNSAAGVDHAAENADLRAMLAHYAPDLDVDVAINDYFNRAGKFTPPTPATPEVNTKPQPNRKRALRFSVDFGCGWCLVWWCELTSTIEIVVDSHIHIKVGCVMRQHSTQINVLGCVVHTGG